MSTLSSQVTIIYISSEPFDPAELDQKQWDKEYYDSAVTIIQTTVSLRLSDSNV
jgi:hypothetical protein